MTFARRQRTTRHLDFRAPNLDTISLAQAQRAAIQELLLPDRLDSSRLEAAVAGYQRKAKMEGRCSNDPVGHVGNNVSWNSPWNASDVGIERHNGESRVVLP